MCEMLELSPLPHTWLLDLDGTIVKHNGYKIDGYDTFLDGAQEFLREIPKEDTVIFLTSREKKYADRTESFLRDNGIRYRMILYEIPYGERILMNDRKPSGLQMAYAVDRARDSKWNLEMTISDN